MFEHDDLYTIYEIAKISGVHIQTLYKRLYRYQYPVKLQDGVYHVYGDVADKLLKADKSGPRKVKVNLVNEKPQQESAN